MINNTKVEPPSSPDIETPNSVMVQPLSPCNNQSSPVDIYHPDEDPLSPANNVVDVCPSVSSTRLTEEFDSNLVVKNQSTVQPDFDFEEEDENIKKPAYTSPLVEDSTIKSDDLFDMIDEVLENQKDISMVDLTQDEGGLDEDISHTPQILTTQFLNHRTQDFNSKLDTKFTKDFQYQNVLKNLYSFLQPQDDYKQW